MLESSNWKENTFHESFNSDVETHWNKIKSKLLELRHKFVPITMTKTSSNSKTKGSFPINSSL